MPAPGESGSEPSRRAAGTGGAGKPPGERSAAVRQAVVLPHVGGDPGAALVPGAGEALGATGAEAGVGAEALSPEPIAPPPPSPSLPPGPPQVVIPAAAPQQSSAAVRTQSE